MDGPFGSLLDENTDPEDVVTRALAVALVVALLVVVGFAMAPISSGDQHTEFYVLGPSGSASNYLENVTVGEPNELRVGIGNFEGQARTYSLVVRTNETSFVRQTVSLDIEEEREESVTVAFESPGRKQLFLDLYVGQETTGEPYRRLWLFVEVAPR